MDTLRAEHATNRKWLDQLHRLLDIEVALRLKAGGYGSIAFALPYRDGIIQSIEDSSVTVYRAAATG